MRTTVAALAVMLAALSLTVTDARAEPPSASQATINGPVVQPRPAAPVATQEPTDGATEEVTEGESASTSPSPSPAARRPVDEEGERWVNLGGDRRHRPARDGGGFPDRRRTAPPPEPPRRVTAAPR